MGKPIKKVVALVITSREGKILLVKRSPDDENLPNMWGLPASSGDSTVQSVASTKLGLDVSSGPVIAEGELDRGSYILHMQLVSASANTETVYSDTQYIDYRWVLLEGVIGFLRHAALQGSLCSALYLRYKSIFDDTRIKQLGVQMVSSTPIQEN